MSILRVAIVLLFALPLSACYRGEGPLAPDPGTEVMVIPSFTLTDQTGATRSETIFRRPGVTVLDFTFTSCTLICPMMNTQMARVLAETEGLRVNAVSISVDPERDTPERLAEHARVIGADTDRWTFLTGDWETVKRISQNGLKLAVGGEDDRVIDLGDGQTMNNIPHSGKFVLVRSDGRPIGLYDGTQPEDVDRLIARLKEAF